MDRKTIKSVGIDIGTTTTQVIFSLLTVVNRAPASQVPAYEFIGRDIVYQSPIHFTPIDYNGFIDDIKLKEFITSQIKNADMTIDAIDTGAIIITGETAKAQNAKSSILKLSQELGDFVVATAGPHLESIIAGRGSGAQTYSKDNHKRVMNIDIGGGTSNYVIFDCGEVVDTACLNIGGRLIEFDSNREVKFVHNAGNMLIKDLFGDNFNGKLTDDHIKRISNKMADVIVEVLTGKASALSAHLLMTPELRNPKDIDVIFLSGGVGECFYKQQIEQIPDNKFFDIGPNLAQSLLKNKTLNDFNIKKPEQTVRATVIGAGAHSLALSGSTIWLNDFELPLKNLPVVHPVINWENTTDVDICNAVQLAASRMDIETYMEHFAIAINKSMPVNYKSVQLLACGLTLFFEKYSNPKKTALVIMHNDIGKAMGMEIQPKLSKHKVMVIDEIITHDGDYIDVGKGYFGGEIVPVTVKSLAFPG